MFRKKAKILKPFEPFKTIQNLKFSIFKVWWPTFVREFAPHLTTPNYCKAATALYIELEYLFSKSIITIVFYAIRCSFL